MGIKEILHKDKTAILSYGHVLSPTDLFLRPGIIPFGTCMCSNIVTSLFKTFHVSPDLEFRTTLATSIFPAEQTFQRNALNIELVFMQKLNNWPTC